jgi:hypothetical protein
MRLALVTAAAVCALCVTAEGKKKKKKQTRHSDEDDNQFYDIYDAIATMEQLAPKTRTFYELLGVAPDATDADVSRAFRRTSVQYHPDKLGAAADARTERMSRLVQSVGSLLRTAEGRARYDWVLNDAPPWHRQAVYYSARGRKGAGTARMSLWGALWLLAVLAVVFPALSEWVSWGLAYYRWRAAKGEVSAMADRDVRRLRGRMAAVVDGSMSPLMLEPAMLAIATADGPAPERPACLGLWPLRVVLWPFKALYRRRRAAADKDD